MDDEIAVVRGHTIAETDLANGLPVSNGLSLTFGKKDKTWPFTSIRYGDIKADCPFGLGVALVEDVRQDLISNIFFVDRRVPGRGF